MPDTYTISELAREFDVTPRTLRFYEEKGLLKPDRQGQARIYHPADRVTLKLILRGKRLGLSLTESSDIIGLYEPGGQNLNQLETLLEKIHERRVQLQAQQQDIRAMLRELKSSEEQTLEAIAAARARPSARRRSNAQRNKQRNKERNTE